MGNKIFLFLCPCCCKHEPEDDNDETNKTETNPYISIIDNEDNNETLKILIKKNKKNDSEVNDRLRQDVLILNVEEKDDVDNSEKIISLGINIGALKTVYSIFSEINGKYVSNVLLMNNSSRIIPSIICYTKSHRLFGDNSLSSLKQNLDTSYNNLSRLIGFDNSQLFENELKYLYRKDKNKKTNEYKFYCYNEKAEKKEIESELLLSDYLSLINYYYFEKEQFIYNITSISVPDFYTDIQKDKLTLICESIGMKDITLYNESSAITMYYGYTKYRDLFVQEKNEVDPTIEKNILFIDIGYSKTSFILSYFTYNKFEVKYVDYIPNIGGRNFDELIYNYCVDKFKQENNIEDSDISIKMKYRLIEEIKKKRIQLTVSDEINILVDSFYEDKDLQLILKKDFLEEKIQDLIKEISNKYEKVLLYSKENKIKIDYVEIAGELMRTPILQSIIEIENLKICKTILIDECTSVGAALYGTFIKGNFPVSQLKNIIPFNPRKEKNSNVNINHLKNKIKEHIEKENKRDSEYENLLIEKSRISKLYYSIKNSIIDKEKFKEQLKKLNQIDKKLKNVKNLESLMSIENELNEISKEISHLKEGEKTESSTQLNE